MVTSLVRFAQPEVYVLIIQQRQTKDDCQQVKKVVVSRQNDQHLQ